jgi:hypothetical protein
MDAAGSSSEDQRANALAAATSARCFRWSEVVASLVFSAATYEMLVLYSIVHWDIMFRWTSKVPQPPQAVFTVLGHLSMLRLVFAALALVWAVWSFQKAPRWATWVALGAAVVALFSNAIVM